MEDDRRYTIALAGNPNCGKSTLFNGLTGSRQHVGNWPGKTVRCERGSYHHGGCTFDVTDLPGTYSLAAYSEDEGITRGYFLREAPDLVVLVLDATNLERHLYLAVQIIEMGVPAVLALNMCDLADRMGQRINIDRLSRQLGGIPVVRVAASKYEGIDELREVVLENVQGSERVGGEQTSIRQLDYSQSLEEELSQLAPLLSKADGLTKRFPTRWLALEMLANGRDLIDELSIDGRSDAILKAVEESKRRVNLVLPDGVDLHIADRRFDAVSRVAEEVLDMEGARPHTWSERIDRVVTHPVLGIPIFLAIMYLVFGLVVDVSAPYLDWIDTVVSGPVTSWSLRALEYLRAPVWVKGLLVEGVIGGVGGVLVFLPGLMMLFAFIAALEDSGYLARAAFVMNRFLSFLGLNGKSFVPLILGFGCAVPAIYATRTLDRKRDRLLTALMVPLMSCSARLPVYVLFSIALFADRAERVIWGLYALGVVMAIAAGWLLSKTLLRTEQASEFMMELPAYRMPTLRGLWAHVSNRTGDFIKGAGTVILLAAMVIWGLLNLPVDADSLEDSVFGRVSGVVAPVFEPAGFGSWEASASLISGLVAKEVVVSTMAEIYLESPVKAQPQEQPSFADEALGIGAGFVSATVDAGRQLVEALTPGINLLPDGDELGRRETALSEILGSIFTPAAGLAFLVYVLLYVPCIATLSVIRAEFGTHWAIFSAVYQSGIAWLAATATYQIGTFFG